MLASLQLAGNAEKPDSAAPPPRPPRFDAVSIEAGIVRSPGLQSTAQFGGSIELRAGSDGAVRVGLAHWVSDGDGPPATTERDFTLAAAYLHTFGKLGPLRAFAGAGAGLHRFSGALSQPDASPTFADHRSLRAGLHLEAGTVLALAPSEQLGLSVTVRYALLGQARNAMSLSLGLRFRPYISGGVQLGEPESPRPGPTNAAEPVSRRQ